jgi:CheY-like chemotaxis protein
MYRTTIANPDQKCKIGMKKLKILIVDDDDSSRDSLKDMIMMRGHDVTTLDEGMKCVNRCSENKFDIIFMDYHIGDLDGELNGTDIIKMIKEYFDVDSTIYAYTGDNTNMAINNCKNSMMKGVFIKPVEPSLINEFFDIVEQNIDDLNGLAKLAIRRKNFTYFGKKKKSVCRISS